jgi:hypothetical protein
MQTENEITAPFEEKRAFPARLAAHKQITDLTAEVARLTALVAAAGVQIAPDGPLRHLSNEDIVGAVARGWCTPTNASKVMDSDLALTIAAEVHKLLAAAPALSERAPSDHADDLAVDRFAAAMKDKMAKSRAKGRSGWDDPAECTERSLRTMLRVHLSKGDPVDVGNFAMMLFNRGERTSVPISLEVRAAIEEANRTGTSAALLPSGGVVFINRGHDYGEDDAAPAPERAIEAPSAGSDEPTERESLIACLEDDAAKLADANPGDEMAQTMRDAARLLGLDAGAPSAGSVGDDPEFDALLTKLESATARSEWDEGKACNELRQQFIAHIDSLLSAARKAALGGTPVEACDANDGVDGEHPRYGRGIFFTLNCMKTLYEFPLDGIAGQSGKDGEPT